MGENAVLRPSISATWRSQASKNALKVNELLAFIRRNVRSVQAGKI